MKGVSGDRKIQFRCSLVSDGMVVIVTALLVFINGCVDNACFEEPGWEEWEAIKLPHLTDNDIAFTAAARCPDGNLIFGTQGGVYREEGEDLWEYYQVSPRHGNITRIISYGDDMLFASQDPGGVFVSEDNGRHWRQVNNHLTSICVYDLAVTPDGSLFAATYEGVFVSRDFGESWTPCSRDIISGGIFSLEVDKMGVVYATGRGVYRTEDGGINWTDISGRLEGSFVSDLIISSHGSILVTSSYSGISKYNRKIQDWTLLYDPGDYVGLDKMIVTKEGDIYVGAGSEGVYFSRDDGVTWENSMYGLFSRIIIALYADAGEVLLCSEEMLQTRDGGSSWTLYPWGGSGSAFPWDCIGITGEGFLVAGRRSSGIYLSEDGGGSWIELWDKTGIKDIVCRGEKVYSIIRSYLMIFDTVTKSVFRKRVIDSEHNELTAIEVDSQGRIYTGNCREGIFRSSDGGETWMDLEVDFEYEYSEYEDMDIEVNGDSVILVCADYNICRSSDHGVSWERLSRTGFSLEISPGGRLYLCSGGGIIASGDNGDTWKRINTQPTAPFTYYPGEAKLEFGENGYILLYQMNNLFCSRDGGKSWYQDHYLNQYRSSSSIKDLTSGPDGHVYIITNDDILRSPHPGSQQY